MNKKDRQGFQKKLIDRKIQLLAALKNISKESLRKSLRDSAGDLSNYSFHMADVGTESYQREISLGIASSEQKELYEIDEALRKLESGKEYGICENCKKNIPFKRLEAVPFAKRCIKCQEEEENNK